MDWRTVEHFDRKEFGFAGDVEPDERLVRRLDDARAVAGIPFFINSGIRSEEDNERVGGADDSAHLTGHAVDIRVSTSRQRQLILSALIAVGFRRIGIGQSFIHVDTDRTKPQDVCWLYGS